MSLNLEEGT